jgi:hypothetical protein
MFSRIKDSILQVDFDKLILGFIGFILIGVSIATTYFLGLYAQLECVRDGPIRCTVNTAWMGRYPVKRTPIPHLQQAIVEESCDNENSCTYRVDLVTDQNTIPLTDSYSSGRQAKQALADQINTFLSDASQPRLDITQAEPLWLLVPLVMGVVGLGMAGKLAIEAVKNIFGPAKDPSET